MNRCKLFYLVLLVLFLVGAGPRSTASRGLWRGTFTQTSPMPWSGQMEIFLRYDMEQAGRQKVDGIISWPGLRMARTKFEGTLQGLTLSFSETECAETACSEVVLGGTYRATFDSQFVDLTGDATGPFGLKGRFSLQKVTSKL